MTRSPRQLPSASVVCHAPMARNLSCLATRSLAEFWVESLSSSSPIALPSALMALRFFPGDPETWVLGYREFMDHPRRSNPLRDGFEETDRTRTIDVVGDIAVVRERFTMRFAARPSVPAADVFTLARAGGAWRTVGARSAAGARAFTR